jgi:penicillin amidase
MPVVKGPRGPIRYERDALGYPRIRARDVLDGAYALGHLHGKDRLLQVQLSVSLAQGKAMELFGDGALFRILDRVTRLFDFSGDTWLQTSRIDDETRSFLESYCAGFNAVANKRSRQMIYRVLGLSPGEHTPASMVLLYRLIAFFGLTSMQHSGEGTIAELVGARVPKRLLAMLLGEKEETLEHVDRLEKWSIPEELRLFLPQLGGSNAFAVSPSRSATGGALLMSEPHMEIGRFPPVLYAAHIDYEDGTYYQGAGIPGIPWLSFGRTANVGWSATYAHGDNIDTMIEHVRAGKYRAVDEWRPLRRRVEEVRIRGKAPERWTFWDNDYGTIVGDAEGEARLPCVRWSGLREVWRDICAILPGMRARDVVELALHHRSVRCISLNAVLADSQGNIGLVQTGQVDVRPKDWTGATPYPAWELASRTPLALGEDERPHVLNPPEGFIVTSNERRDGPHGERWCTLPEGHYRHQRLTQILSEVARADLSTLVRASYDERDLCAERLLPVWERFLPADAKSLVRWSTRQGVSSPAEHHAMIGLFHTLHAEATRVLLARWVGGAAARRFVYELSLGVVFQEHLDAAFALERPEVFSESDLESVLAHAWPAALDRVHRHRGAAPVIAGFKNVLMRGILPTALGFDHPPSEMPGGPTSPFQMRQVRFLGENLVFGPALHLLFDMSKPGAFYHLPGGASEERLGPGYGAGVDLWKEGRFIPLGDADQKAPSLHHNTRRPRGRVPSLKGALRRVPGRLRRVRPGD